MSSQVEICNMALAHIRSAGINSITEASLQAQYCNLFYDQALEFSLSDAPWNFARKQVALALTSKDAFSWVYAYQYPTDCLKINRIRSSAERITDTSDSGLVSRPGYRSDEVQNGPIRVAYEVLNIENTKIIGCDESSAWVDYQLRIDDSNKYSPSFILAFSYYLASLIAMPIIGGDNGRKERESMLQLYRITSANALSNNANESDKVPAEPDSEYITAR